jgi:hypothetical protein
MIFYSCAVTKYPKETSQIVIAAKRVILSLVGKGMRHP